MIEAEIHAINNKEFEISSQHNLICCDCGLKHSVKLRSLFLAEGFLQRTT